MKASIYDVAKKSGISVVTVSRVINNAPTVRQSSIDKVMKAIKELDYSPNAAARSLAGGKSKVIGMVIPDITDPFIMSVVIAVGEQLREKGYFLTLAVAGEDTDVEEQIGKFLFQPERVDGIILLTPLFENEFISLLQSRSIPFVILDNQNYPFTVSSVVVDNEKGGYDAASALYQTGHKRIAHIGGPENLLSARDRANGFLKALEEVGAICYGIEKGDFSIESGYSTMKKWHETGLLPDAVFAGDDHIAFGVLDYLREQGLSVPKDVSLIGFDNHPFCSQLHPMLSTFSQPAEMMALKGVDLLLKTMSGELKRHTIIKLEPLLIQRQSVKER